jgi:hypothetical protein
MRCGSSIDEQDQFCRKCGAQSSALAAPASVTPATAAVPAQTSGKAIASLVCGLLFFVPFAFVAAVIFGHLGLSEDSKKRGTAERRRDGHRWVSSRLYVGGEHSNHSDNRRDRNSESVARAYGGQ